MMIVAFVAFTMGILVDFFRIDECAIDEYDWITIDVYQQTRFHFDFD